MAIRYLDGRLEVDGVFVDRIAAACPTPFYVYSWGTIAERVAILRRALSGIDHEIRYAVKANPARAILHRLGRLGVGFDLVSGGELHRVIAAGGAPGRCVFAGVGKTEDEIARALEVGIGALHLESADEFETVDRIARTLGVRARVGLRVNPDVEVDTHGYVRTATRHDKFGVDLETAVELAHRISASEALELVGYHVHLGSLLRESEPYLEACRKVLETLENAGALTETVRYYDCGGGFAGAGACPAGGDPAPGNEAEFDFEGLARGMRDLLGPRGLRLLVEPGRWIAGDAGILVTRVLRCKPGGGRSFVVVDAAMTELIRPALYGAEHPIAPVCEPDRRPRFPCDVVGPVCESADFLARDRELPRLRNGELLAVFASGAYASAMASHYNSRPFAAEVLCEDGRMLLIRKRQALDDLLRDEIEAGLDLTGNAGDPPTRGDER